MKKIDPALELLTIKNHMKNDIQRMKHYYCKHEKGISRIFNERAIARKHISLRM